MSHEDKQKRCPMIHPWIVMETDEEGTSMIKVEPQGCMKEECELWVIDKEAKWEGCSIRSIAEEMFLHRQV